MDSGLTEGENEPQFAEGEIEAEKCWLWWATPSEYQGDLPWGETTEYLHQELGIPAYLPVLGRILDPYHQDPEKVFQVFWPQFSHLEIRALSLSS